MSGAAKDDRLLSKVAPTPSAMEGAMTARQVCRKLALPERTLTSASPEPILKPCAAQTHIPGPPNHREKNESYPVVASLNDKTRVIRCKDNIQWIVQRKSGEHWQGRSFCRTRSALIREAKHRLGPDLPQAALQILQALPEYYDDVPSEAG
jgi:hypothetical protein